MSNLPFDYEKSPNLPLLGLKMIVCLVDFFVCKVVFRSWKNGVFWENVIFSEFIEICDNLNLNFAYFFRKCANTYWTFKSQFVLFVARNGSIAQNVTMKFQTTN